MVMQASQYNKNDRKFKSTGELIGTLVDVASKGGNFLLNVGPTPDGTIQPEFEERLRGIGAWLQINGEAIYGTTYGPVQGMANAKTTQKGNTVYLHIFDRPRGRFDLEGFEPRVLSAALLAGGRPIAFTQSADHLEIQLPPEAPDLNVTVIALKTK
jgi:alpha-L-fucosidase